MSFRFIFHNPHTNIWFKKPLYFYLTKRKSVDKYEYMMDYCLNNGIDFAFLCDGADFSFGRNFFKGAFTSKIELILWCWLNKINPFKVKILTRFDQLKESDVIFSFLYGNFLNVFESAGKEKRSIINNFRMTKAFTVVHLTHYMYNASTGGHNTQLADIDLFVAENNLFKNSGFFREFYGWYKKEVYALPFVPQKRFKNIKPFLDRKNKAVATGTLPLQMMDKDFLHHFTSGDIHPMRRIIYNHQQELSNLMDCYIHEVTEGKKVEVVKKSDNWFKKIYNTIYRNFFYKQQQYFSFNIVELYNSYKMFVVPEEVNDLPGIGFVEGMACGCVYVGKIDPMYADMGLVDGVHYIGYNGTLEDLKGKIEFYLANDDLLEVIAKNGYKYIVDRINPNVVTSEFFKAIENKMNEKK